MHPASVYSQNHVCLLLKGNKLTRSISKRWYFQQFACFLHFIYFIHTAVCSLFSLLAPSLVSTLHCETGVFSAFLSLCHSKSNKMWA